MSCSAEPRTERWARVARESSRQARRVRLPGILPAVRFEQSLAEETSAPPFLRALPADRASSLRVALLVCPESGWTDAEQSASAAGAWAPVSLGPQVLRAETAASAAIAIVMNAWL